MNRDDATKAQVRAADPRTSTWLSANAGSGKTRVLTDRVARLLYDQVNPMHILCLTYTKAAASEMQNRLFDRLGAWAMMPDGDLKQALLHLGVPNPITNSDLGRARTLFAKAIETPGGLRIQTIHSFCAGLLRRFPLEAGISPQFREMEDAQAAALRAQTLEDIALENPNVLAGIAAYETDGGLDKLLAAITRDRNDLLNLPDDATLRAAFDLADDITPDRLLADTFSIGDAALLQDLFQTCKAGSSTEQKIAQQVFGIQDPFTFADIKALETPFLFGKDAKTPFAAKIDKLGTKSTREAHPALFDGLNDLMERIEAAREPRLSLDALTKSRALHAFATDFLARYEARKQSQGMLDFDDLIGKARALLTAPEVAQWVLFRLDGGIDHILVDEAQDTSPDQWHVIRSLAQEFSAGEGAQSDRQRTIFVVGDKKQSIYSFQGADPAGFDQMHDHFQTELSQVNQPFQASELRHSFRSSQAILGTVDRVFQGEQNPNMQWDYKAHAAFKSNMPGRVDIWPTIETTKDDSKFDWTAPVDTVSAKDAKVQLADKIAKSIRDMVYDNPQTIPCEIEHTGEYNHRPITEGDILILVQGRGGEQGVSLFSEIIRACKAADLKIAGADRLRVGAELAVKDITALLRFLALSEDDLSLAAALKSPLFGWSEQELYQLAQPRPDKGYLWPALRDATGYDETLAILHDLRKQSDFLRPYDLINRMLTRHDGRRKLLARLGPEAEDGIDALLSQSLSYESGNIPGLTGFLEWMQTDEMEIKRQMDSAENRIRVMTVHGAKGLEAPIVFLPDTTKRNAPTVGPLLETDSAIIWPPKADDLPEGIRAQRDAKAALQIEERNRLLYVAMTRAECWLITCAAGEVKPGDGGWHDLIGGAMDHMGQADCDFPTGTGKRYSTGDWQSGTLQPPKQPTKPTSETDTPFPILPDHPLAEPTRSPSDLGGTKALPGETSDGTDDIARARGTFIHLLLEHLPNSAPADRITLANRLAGAQEDSATLPNLNQIIADTCALIDTPHLQDMFQSGLTEAEITADIPNLGRLTGAIDRLIITDTTVTAIDYKSNRIVPGHPDETPDGLLRQMGAYHAMLAAIWPDKQIDTAILWTATATLMPLPPALTAAALASVTTP